MFLVKYNKLLHKWPTKVEKRKDYLDSNNLTNTHRHKLKNPMAKAPCLLTIYQKPGFERF